MNEFAEACFAIGGWCIALAACGYSVQRLQKDRREAREKTERSARLWVEVWR